MSSVSGLTIFNAFGFDVDILVNSVGIEMDRALDNKYNLHFEFTKVYVDYDDCLIINNKVNIKLVEFLYRCLNEGKEIFLITKHELDLKENLKKYRLYNLFDEILHINKIDDKYKYIKNSDCIFIDDSFAERKAVKEKLGIPVFSPDMIETLL